MPNHLHNQELKQTTTDLSYCDETITPDCLRALYNIPTLPANYQASSKNSFGIAGYAPNKYNSTDLKSFFATLSTNQVQTKAKYISIDGGNNHYSGTGVEAYIESNLNLSYSMSLVNPIPVTLYQAGDKTNSATFDDFWMPLTLLTVTREKTIVEALLQPKSFPPVIAIMKLI